MWLSTGFPAKDLVSLRLHTTDREVLTDYGAMPKDGGNEQKDDDQSLVALPLFAQGMNALLRDDLSVDPADTLNASPSLGTTSFQSQPRRTALWAW